MRLTSLTPWRWTPQNPAVHRGTDPFSLLQRDINHLLEGFFEDSPLKFAGGEAGLLTPKVDLSETEQDFVLTLEMPGLKEEDIEVEFTGDGLRIRGEKKDERDEQQHNFHRVERTFGLFERVISLPADVNREGTQATYKNGVLHVTVPKAVAAPSTHKIAVKPGS